MNSRFYLIHSLLLLSLALVSPRLAAEIPLQAFTASYDLHKGSMHVANSEIGLQQEDRLWSWHTTTMARGIYALFIKDKFSTRTSFTQADKQIKVQQIVNLDPGSQEVHESASFDWSAGNIEVFRKGERKHVALDAEVYDYLSIHLLAVSMRMRQLQELTVDFYRKGKLTRATLVYGGSGSIDVNGETVRAEIFEQATVKSKSKLKYFYSVDTPLLPLRIEKRRPGESVVTMTLRDVNWDL